MWNATKEWYKTEHIVIMFSLHVNKQQIISYYIH